MPTDKSPPDWFPGKLNLQKSLDACIDSIERQLYRLAPRRNIPSELAAERVARELIARIRTGSAKQ